MVMGYVLFRHEFKWVRMRGWVTLRQMTALQQE